MSYKILCKSYHDIELDIVYLENKEDKKQVMKCFWNEFDSIISDHGFCFALTVLLCDWLSNILKLDNIINCNYIENLSGWLRIISFFT